MARANNAQKKLIHVYGSMLGIDDETRRDQLEQTYGVRSSKDLSELQAEEYLDKLRTACAETGKLKDHRKLPRQAYRRFEHLRHRADYWASPAQLRKIEAMWMDASWMPTRDAAEAALDSWLSRQFHIKNIEMIPRARVGAIITAIEAIKRQEDTNGKKPGQNNQTGSVGSESDEPLEDEARRMQGGNR